MYNAQSKNHSINNTISRKYHVVSIVSSERDSHAIYHPSEWGTEQSISLFGGSGTIRASDTDTCRTWASTIRRMSYNETSFFPYHDSTLVVLVLTHGNRHNFTIKRRFGLGSVGINRTATTANIANVAEELGFAHTIIADTSCHSADHERADPSDITGCLGEWNVLLDKLSTSVFRNSGRSSGPSVSFKSSVDTTEETCRINVRRNDWSTSVTYDVLNFLDDKDRGYWYTANRNGILKYISAGALFIQALASFPALTITECAALSTTFCPGLTSSCTSLCVPGPTFGALWNRGPELHSAPSVYDLGHLYGIPPVESLSRPMIRSLNRAPLIPRLTSPRESAFQDPLPIRLETINFFSRYGLITPSSIEVRVPSYTYDIHPTMSIRAGVNVFLEFILDEPCFMSLTASNLPDTVQPPMIVDGRDSRLDLRVSTLPPGKYFVVCYATSRISNPDFHFNITNHSSESQSVHTTVFDTLNHFPRFPRAPLARLNPPRLHDPVALVRNMVGRPRRACRNSETAPNAATDDIPGIAYDSGAPPSYDSLFPASHVFEPTNLSFDDFLPDYKE